MTKPIVYTDGAGNYFQPNGVTAAAPTMTQVGVTGIGQGRGSTPMLTTSLPLPGWTIAPNLSDIGGGVWVNGLLVDPQ